MSTIKGITRLKRLNIGGYKSISPYHPVTVELGNINILLGANGSGKSNIVSFFKMLNFMMNGSFQLYVEKEGTSQVFLHYGSKNTTNIKGELLFESDTHTDFYRFHLTHAVSDKLIISSEEIERKAQSNEQETQIMPLISGLNESALIKRQDNIYHILSNCKVYQFHDSSNESPIRQSSPVGLVNYLQSEGNNLASFLHYLKKKHRSNYDRIVSYVQLIMPQFKDFYLEPNDREYVSLKWTDIFPNDYVFLPELFSDGTIRFIALATLLLQPKETMPRVVVIDEPELGLHPFAIEQLAAMIKEASKHNQIIVATQSPGLVDEFDARQITIIESENGYSTARRLDENELKDWLENYSISELWNKNVLGGRP